MKRKRILTVFLMAVLLTACSKNSPEASVPMVSTAAGANVETTEVRMPAGAEEAPDELEIGDTPLTEGGGEGGLAYFASWGDVIMYYDSFGPYIGLYDLGTAVSGSEWIEELSGEILIEPNGADLTD